jgi:enediyne biosynthesis protein CalE5
MIPTPPPPTPDEQLAKSKQQWEEASAGWERWSDWFEAQVRPLTHALLDAAGLARGMTVLDLACGPGGLAEQVAARVRPGGRVVATDISPGMVEATRRRAQRLAIDDLEAREMDAQALAFDDASFGAATCRFGLMLCPEPARAAAEAHRVLVPGGRYALAVWDEPAKNPMFEVMAEVVGRYVPVPPLDPTQPGPFRLSAPGECERVLRGAGFADVAVEPFPMSWAYGPPEHFWRVQRDMSSPLRNATATLEPRELARLEADLNRAVTPFVVGGEVCFGMTPLLARATR